MEIPLSMINEAFTLRKGVKANPDLKKITKKLEQYSVEQLLFKTEGNKRISALIHQLHSIFVTGRNDQYKLACLIKVAHNYLDRFFTTGDLKNLVLFVYCNGYLKIDNNIFGAGKRRFKGKIKLVGYLKELIQKVEIKIDPRFDADYYEKNLMQLAKEGFLDNDLNKVYNFILAVERGGRGFHFNFLLENLLYFYFQFDTNAFVKQLNVLSDPIIIVFYFQSFPRQALLTLLEHRLLTNCWVIFELARLLTDHPRKEKKYIRKDVAILARSFNKIYLYNKALYTQAIGFLHRSNLFNAALGNQLANLNDGDIISLFSTWLPLSKYDNNLEARNLLLEELGLQLTRDQYKIALNAAFNRWKSLWDEILFNDEEYINDLLQTDFANFVIHYYLEGQEDVIIEEIKNLLSRLAWIDSEWSPNASHQIKSFYLNFSFFYLLSYAYKNKNLRNLEVEGLLAHLTENAILAARMSNEAYFTHLNIARKNMITAIS